MSKEALGLCSRGVSLANNGVRYWDYAYEVAGLPAGRRAYIEHRGHVWQMQRVIEGVPDNWRGEFSSPEAALAALEREWLPDGPAVFTVSDIAWGDWVLLRMALGDSSGMQGSGYALYRDGDPAPVRPDNRLLGELRHSLVVRAECDGVSAWLVRGREVTRLGDFRSQ